MQLPGIDFRDVIFPSLPFPELWLRIISRYIDFVVHVAIIFETDLGSIMEENWVLKILWSQNDSHKMGFTSILIFFLNENGRLMDHYGGKLLKTRKTYFNVQNRCDAPLDESRSHLTQSLENQYEGR